MLSHKNPYIFLVLALTLLVLTAQASGPVDPGDDDLPYYDPWDNNPPGPPPNYNLIDSSYLLGVPELPEPLENNAGGYYIYYDTAVGKWYVANFLYSRGNSLEQFHGSILAIMEQDPTPGVNVWALGFELSSDLKQNDRWGWVRWPDSIAENLYEVWWDFTIDYAKPKDTGDFRDTLGIEIAGEAIDFNIWSSGHGDPFGEDQVYLGDDKTPLSDVPDFEDTYAGITDQYQVNDPEVDPNTSRFTAKDLTGASYNADGLIPNNKSCNYNERYSGSWAYEGNGLQFAVRYSPNNTVPTFEQEDDTLAVLLCAGQSISDSVSATDPSPNDTLTLIKLSGPGSFTSIPSTTRVVGYYDFSPATSGFYTFEFEADDGQGGLDTLTLVYDITISEAPTVELPDDTTIFACDPLEICVPVDISDPDCDITSVTTNNGSYSGTLANYDQVDRITALGGTVIQVGGGNPGGVLTSASDFVLPINSQSGVSVTLPNFAFADAVTDYGTFPNVLESGNAADYMLGGPTDLTFTTPGAGGPDGGPGDGSVAFAAGDHCALGFLYEITTCNGANTDLMILTNTNGGGTADLALRLDGTDVYSFSRVIPGQSAGSGVGGVTFDLPDGITFDEISISCVSGYLEIDAVAARTAPSSTTEDVCITLDTTGVYEIEVTAEDGCENTGSDLMYVTFNLNRPPSVNGGDDYTQLMCTLSQMCFYIAYGDPDDNLSSVELYTGPGVLAGNQVCFTPTGAGPVQFVFRAVDECGLEDYDTVVVTVVLNSPPVANDPDPIILAQCLAEEICYDLTATDPNGQTLSWSLWAGVGSVTSGGHFCFTPTITGSYAAALIVVDSCGAADTTGLDFYVTVNTPPVAVDPSSPVDLVQCAATEVCYDFAASDAQGGPLVWSQLSGDGSLSTGGQWCFTPSASGTFSTTVVVTDSCGAADTTSLTYNVTVNNPPQVAFGNDTTLALCQAQEICVSYEATDPNSFDNLLETLISGYGSIDTAANTVCFTPTTSGSYEVIVAVSDACGESDRDTVVVNVSFGEAATIVCPFDPIDVFLCQADQVCQSVTVSPASATVSVSYGSYAGGELCFAADTSGTYLITLIAAQTCGADTCQLVFNVDIGQTAQIDCPEPSSAFVCEPGNVCIPVGVFGTDVSTTVSPIGAYAAGEVCFFADTAGHYELTVIASGDCGTDTCLVTVDVTMNAAPVMSDPVGPLDTFLCVGAGICYQFAATDTDGGDLVFSRISGNGTVSSDGLWCFTAGAAGSYSVVVGVTDDCGATDQTSLTYNVTLNTAPSVNLGPDSTFFACITGQICRPYTTTDPDDNIATVELVSGAATIDTDFSTLCFVPPVEGTYTFVVRVVDECGAAGYDSVSYTIDLNQPPVADAGDDLTIFDCELQQICWPASVTDPDGNLVSTQLVDGPGAFDGSHICFTPTGTYNYEFVLKGSDACGLESFDTMAVYYTLNSPPVAHAGPDQTVFQCTPTTICWPASCDDADGNLTTCALVSGPGSYNGSNICFMPTASGSYEFAVEATDACGETDRDTVVIDVTINSAPVCVIPNDTLIIQCLATEVCLPAYGNDVNGNLDVCQIISGPGSLVGGNWCYTPTADQSVTVTVRCEDSCGAFCQSSFTVEFDINGPPEIAFGNDTSLFLCEIAEICLPYVASDPDDPRPTTTTLISGSGLLDQENSVVCFTPGAGGDYQFVIRIEDECGRVDQDTINVAATINTPPVADVGDDQSIFLCGPEEICWPVSCSDAEGNLTDCIFVGPGTYDGSDICFTPATSGAYTFTLRAIDDCGAQHIDTVVIDIVYNATPTVVMSTDTTLFLCTPQEVCVSYQVSDGNGLVGITEAMESGYGTIDTAANTVCFMPTASGNYEIIVSATDSCGAVGIDAIMVNIELGQVAQIDCPTAPYDVFLCDSDSIVQALTVSPSGATVTTSYGAFDDGAVRFPADTAGTYTITVIAAASCGADTCDLVFNVTMNTPPVANAGTDQTLFQCMPTQICWSAGCSDIDGNLTSCQLISGIGSYNGSQICFTPTGSDSYQFVLKATDACGAEDYDTATVNVTLNSAPSVAAQADTSLFQCDAAEICLTYTPSDPDGLTGLIETMLSGFGSIDTLNNRICFTPTASGTYEFVVGVTDPCGAVAADTVVATVTLGEMAVIDCPADPIDVFLCESDSIHQTLGVTPDSADITVSYGVYENGQLHFLADTTGTYNITIIAGIQCGADTCVLTFVVEIGEAAQIDCPAASTRFLCQPNNICLPLGVYGAGASVTVSPIGSYAGGNLCFFADTSGHYEILVQASTDCGSDSCLVIVDVTINSAPVAADPTTPVDTFMCAGAQVCYQFEAGDVDGQTLTFTRLSGNGNITSGGLWCFDAATSGAYTIVARVSDPCGGADTTTLTYNVVINSAPVVTLPGDTAVFLCSGEGYCFNYTATDADDNITQEELIAAQGSIDTDADEVCFTPTASGSYQFIVRATDACGAIGADTVSITVDLGTVVTVTCPADTSRFLCAPTQVCRPVSASQAGAVVTVSPIGSYSSGQVCFFADTAGHYELTVVAESACGADTCSFAVDVTLNSPPVADDPVSPVDTFLCVPGTISCPFTAGDADGQTLTWSRLSGNGSVTSAGLWTFTANTSGTYQICAQVVDPCGAADTVCKVVNVTLNAPPVIAFARNLTYFLCQPQEICLSYTTNDPDNNIVLEEMVIGAGMIDTLTNSICFTPDTAGYYFFDIRVTDACGATDLDTLGVTIFFNSPPVVNAGSDRTLFQCAPTEVCWPATCNDPDNNQDSCYVVSPAGYYANGNICFTPDTAGVYSIILRAVDECAAADEDTVVVHVELNSPPVCQVPGDTSFFQCTPVQVSLPVGANDPDGNFSHCELVSGPGAIVGGNWVFTPSSDQNVLVKVMCLDDCGASCIDSFAVSFEVNNRPTVDAGSDSTWFLCQPTTICWPVTITDDEDNVVLVEVVSESGYYDEATGSICFSVPEGERSYRFILRALDECGGENFDTAIVTIDFNAPPTLGLPPNFIAYLDEPGQVCFDVSPADEDGNLQSVSVSPFGTYSSATGQVCFQADSSGIYCMEITATDACSFTVDSLCIEVVIDECIHVQVEKTHNAIQGQPETVRIFLNGSGKDLGGYNLLLAYDHSALTVNNVLPGEAFVNCGWEYFNFRFGADGNCGGCPSGLLRIVAIAETNNGAYHPGCFLNSVIGSIADIEFLVSDDRTLECQYAPVQLFWTDCGDNAFSSRLGDTLWISRHVYDFEHHSLEDNSYGFPGYFGAPDSCLIGGGPGKPAAIRCVDFTNGGVDIVCADSIDARGDVNLNGVSYEVADAVLLSNYFVYGLSVFDVNLDGQVAATDVNADGVTLSVADLVYLIRIIVGDVPAMPKLAPGESLEALLATQNGVLSLLECPLRVGAISIVLEGEVTPALAAAATNMELRYNFDGENTRVLIFNMNGAAYLEGGDILNLDGSTIKEIGVGSYEGLILKANLDVLPDSYFLAQNYPNPFNPTTTFEFGLPVASDWRLVVYNVLGQKVTDWEGSDQAGYVTIHWNADHLASGIYFYRLSAGDFSSSKKMVLLK
ncbi:MAG: T9SS type A sorting domain-containing protein [bacterium]